MPSSCGSFIGNRSVDFPDLQIRIPFDPNADDAMALNSCSWLFQETLDLELLPPNPTLGATKLIWVGTGKGKGKGRNRSPGEPPHTLP